MDILFWNMFIEHGLPLIIIILISYVVARFGELLIELIIRKVVGRLHTDVSEEDVKKRQDTLISLSRTFFKVIVWLVATFTILRRFGVDITPLLAGASVLGVALGFGAQSLIKDFLSGLFIIIENQYRVGDVVDINGSAGTIEQVTVRSTTLRDWDGNVHYVPNGSITKVINKTMGFSKVNLTVSVAGDTDINKLTKVINAVGQEMSEESKWKDLIMDPPHFIAIDNFTEKALEINIVGTTHPSAQWKVTSELRKQLLAAFKKAKIELS